MVTEKDENVSLIYSPNLLHLKCGIVCGQGNLRVPLLTAVVLVVSSVHLLSLVLGVLVSLELVKGILALGLGQSVDLEANGGSQKLLGHGV